MMFGFGDAQNTDEHTLNLAEEYVYDFIVNLVTRAFKRAQRRDPSGRELTKEDLLYFLKQNSKMYIRVVQMIQSYDKINKVNKKKQELI